MWQILWYNCTITVIFTIKYETLRKILWQGCQTQSLSYQKRQQNIISVHEEMFFNGWEKQKGLRTKHQDFKINLTDNKTHTPLAETMTVTFWHTLGKSKIIGFIKYRRKMSSTSGDRDDRRSRSCSRGMRAREAASCHPEQRTYSKAKAHHCEHVPSPF